MGLFQAERPLLEHADRRSGRGFYVLADRQASFGLVPRTGVRLQLCWRAPEVDRYERRSFDRSEKKHL